MKPFHIRHFLSAWRTPRRPEVEQHDAALEARGRVGLSVQTGQREANLLLDAFAEFQERAGGLERGVGERRGDALVADQLGELDIRVAVGPYLLLRDHYGKAV